MIPQHQMHRIDPINATDPVSGTAEAGSTVTVTYPDGTTATVVAGTDGSWSVPNPGNLVDGDTVTATATDPAGNTSLPGNTSYRHSLCRHHSTCGCAG
ncbi:Ig-like domain-containing protein [Acinetobacter baumannii]|uniref:Ig-like domain-containing protein n=1 Tax=Acinetobacter baumannii TaxID=470 RepID=UPI00321C0B43